ncbi:MAG: pyridoxal 5'-phosphate synthase lyase subunit PdxS [Candidatus Altiarchaeota archaeon]|nr:pyridoxal 5'-phosphate synthase lyase subunit PdxS [Candidatus Altiarchaeota archaeon]
MAETKGTDQIKQGFARMVKHGVIMDVTTAEQAKIAEKAGAVAVMALERVPADIRAQGGVARMADPLKIREIMAAVTIPVMAKCRIGHIAEAQILQELSVDMIDESEVLTPADEEHHVDKTKFTVPFVCGARDLGEALRRINEGAAMIRTKGEAGTGNIVEAVRHMNKINTGLKKLTNLAMNNDEMGLKQAVKEYSVPLDLIKKTAQLGRLPVVNFAAGGIATPADASLMMQMGADGVFVGSGIFKSSAPAKVAKAIVEAVLHYNNPKELLNASAGLGKAMEGLDIRTMDEKQKLQHRGV